MNNHLKLTRTLYILNLHVINIINKLHKCHIYPNQCSNLQHLQILIIFFWKHVTFLLSHACILCKAIREGTCGCENPGGRQMNQEKRNRDLEWVIESYSNSLPNSSNINIALAGLPSCRGILFYPKN